MGTADLSTGGVNAGYRFLRIMSLVRQDPSYSHGKCKMRGGKLHFTREKVKYARPNVIYTLTCDLLSRKREFHYGKWNCHA